MRITRRVHGPWSLVVVVVLASGSCSDASKGGDSQSNGTTSSTAAAAVDLLPVDMRFELSGQPAPLTHAFVLEMQNQGAGTVPSFDADCTYDNAGSKGGIDAVTGGYLNGFKSFTYKQLTAITGPTPSNSASVTCVVDPDNRVNETNEENNTIAFPVPIP